MPVFPTKQSANFNFSGLDCGLSCCIDILYGVGVRLPYTNRLGRKKVRKIRIKMVLAMLAITAQL